MSASRFFMVLTPNISVSAPLRDRQLILDRQL